MNHVAAGALCPASAKRIGGPPAVTGIGYGLAVRGASHPGWILALGVLPPAARHPPAQNGLMLTAHVAGGR